MESIAKLFQNWIWKTVLEKSSRIFSRHGMMMLARDPSASAGALRCQAGGGQVEIKALAKLTGIEEAQLINYLKATGLKVGLLIHPVK
jgi:hypothetical protein